MQNDENEKMIEVNAAAGINGDLAVALLDRMAQLEARMMAKLDKLQPALSGPLTISGDGYIGLEEAASFYGLSERSLRRYAEAGFVPSFRLPGGRSLRFKRSDLEASMIRLHDPQARKGA